MNENNVVNDTQSAVVAQTEGKAEKGGTDSGATTEPAARRQSARNNSGFRRMRLENAALRAQVRELEGLRDVKAQCDIYLNRLVEDKMQRDLEELQKLDPAITDLHGIGEDFIRLVQNGIDAKLAYHAVKQAALSATPPTPPMTGAVGTAGKGVPEFYSSKELDRLSARDLEDPVIFRKAMRSLKKL